MPASFPPFSFSYIPFEERQREGERGRKNPETTETTHITAAPAAREHEVLRPSWRKRSIRRALTLYGFFLNVETEIAPDADPSASQANLRLTSNAQGEKDRARWRVMTQLSS